MQLNIHPEIRAVLERGGPVVALESTLITHGFSTPDNINIALSIEAAVREQGAVPATIAILSGEITVGLSQDQIEYLATAQNVRKCSRRDLPIAIARREDGGVKRNRVAAHRVEQRLAQRARAAIGGTGHHDERGLVRSQVRGRAPRPAITIYITRHPSVHALVNGSRIVHQVVPI